MQIYVKIKAAGKRRDILTPVPYQIPDGVATLGQLLTAIVQQEVTQYNQKPREMPLLPWLTQAQIDQQATAGKVSFGTIYSPRKADPSKAVQNAIQCWKDGLVRVFLEEQELLDLEAPLVIAPDATFTFIRLTFLSGWR